MYRVIFYDYVVEWKRELTVPQRVARYAVVDAEGTQIAFGSKDVCIKICLKLNSL